MKWLKQQFQELIKESGIDGDDGTPELQKAFEGSALKKGAADDLENRGEGITLNRCQGTFVDLEDLVQQIEGERKDLKIAVIEENFDFGNGCIELLFWDLFATTVMKRLK